MACRATTGSGSSSTVEGQTDPGFGVPAPGNPRGNGHHLFEHHPQNDEWANLTPDLGVRRTLRSGGPQDPWILDLTPCITRIWGPADPSGPILGSPDPVVACTKGVQIGVKKGSKMTPFLILNGVRSGLKKGPLRTNTFLGQKVVTVSCTNTPEKGVKKWFLLALLEGPGDPGIR